MEGKATIQLDREQLEMIASSLLGTAFLFQEQGRTQEMEQRITLASLVLTAKFKLQHLKTEEKPSMHG